MPFLLSTTGALFSLTPGESVTIGRDPSCELCLPDDALSRRHARLHLGLRSQHLLEDLGSSNGTYLNRERITRAELRDGDKLLVGASLLTFLAHAPSKDGRATPAEVETVSVREPSGAAEDPGANLAGRLSSLGLIELLQLLTQSRRTGRLELRYPSGVAQVDIIDGALVHAAFRGVQGMPALFAIVLKRDGAFWFVELEAAPTRTILLTTNQALFELCRVLDEVERDEESP